MLVSAMDNLNDREKHILTERRLTDDPKTLEELSQVYGVSRERVRQIEVRAFEKLQKAMMRLAGEKRLIADGNRFVDGSNPLKCGDGDILEVFVAAAPWAGYQGRDLVLCVPGGGGELYRFGAGHITRPDAGN